MWLSFCGSRPLYQSWPWWWIDFLILSIFFQTFAFWLIPSFYWIFEKLTIWMFSVCYLIVKSAAYLAINQIITARFQIWNLKYILLNYNFDFFPAPPISCRHCEGDACLDGKTGELKVCTAGESSCLYMNANGTY